MMAKSDHSSDEWFGDGLQFQCTQCGNCCTGPPGAVWFTDEEGESMANQLGMTLAAFRKRWARRLKDGWSLKETLTEHGWDCVFLDRQTVSGKAICRLYGARPGQCRTWPFWPENLESRAAWEDARRQTPCPGMGQGPLIPVEDIRISRDGNT
ncbi:MAG: YkgJ family cysteine cluster protein [Planctomycetota bacterium]|nr:YkgJ family cysteine cluster protein [Planctomycetota bacterium]